MSFIPLNEAKENFLKECDIQIKDALSKLDKDLGLVDILRNWLINLYNAFAANFTDDQNRFFQPVHSKSGSAVLDTRKELGEVEAENNPKNSTSQ